MTWTAIWTTLNQSKVEFFICKGRPLRMQTWFPLTMASKNCLRLRAYLTNFGDLWLLGEFAGSFRKRVWHVAAYPTCHAQPNMSRTLQNYTLWASLTCRAPQHVARLVWHVAHLSWARFCLNSLGSAPNHSCKGYEYTMRVQGGSLGLYKFHLKKFHAQNPLSNVFSWHLWTLHAVVFMVSFCPEID